MTDRELLENAAKAAGMAVDTQIGLWNWCDHGRFNGGMYRMHRTILEYWNPLTDDGDALRLAVKLEMCIDFMNKRVIAGDSCPDIIIDFEDDYKRAIVHAAAEIGKAML